MTVKYVPVTLYCSALALVEAKLLVLMFGPNMNSRAYHHFDFAYYNFGYTFFCCLLIYINQGKNPKFQILSTTYPFLPPKGVHAKIINGLLGKNYFLEKVLWGSFLT